LLITLLFILFICVGCSPQDSSDQIDDPDNTVDAETVTEKDPEHQADEGKILIAAVNFPPFEIVENGEFSGPGIEIVTEAFHRMGYSEDSYEFVVYPWARILEMVRAGDIDLVVDISLNEERQEFISFSKEPFTNYDKHFITLADSDIIFTGDIKSLEEYTIGVVRDYRIGPNYQEDRASGLYDFEDASSFEENIHKLINGRVPVILDTTLAVLSHLSKEDNADLVKTIGPAYDSTTTYMGFSKVLNNIELLESYDKAIQEMTEDGTIQSIYDKYFK